MVKTHTAGPVWAVPKMKKPYEAFFLLKGFFPRVFPQKPIGQVVY
jgi:hypothetical protein